MSKYLQAMQNGLEAAGDLATIVGPTLIVEVLERDKVTASGIVMQSNLMDRNRELKECVVLAVGKGYYNDDTGADEPLDTAPGDTIFVEPSYVNLLADFPIKDYKHNTIGVVNDGAIKIRFKAGGAEAFRKGTGAVS